MKADSEILKKLETYYSEYVKITKHAKPEMANCGQFIGKSANKADLAAFITPVMGFIAKNQE